VWSDIVPEFWTAFIAARDEDEDVEGKKSVSVPSRTGEFLKQIMREQFSRSLPRCGLPLQHLLNQTHKNLHLGVRHV
jgi:hypothetical protein